MFSNGNRESFFKTKEHIKYSPLSQVIVEPTNEKEEKENKKQNEMAETNGYENSDVELGLLLDTPRNNDTLRVDESDDEHDNDDDYYDCVDNADDEKDNKKKNEEQSLQELNYKIEDADEDDDDDYHDCENNNDNEEENITDEHEALLRDFRSIGINFSPENASESDNKQSSSSSSSSINNLLFGLSILVSAGISVPTAVFALVLLSGMPIKTAGEDIQAWWDSMSTVQKTLSIIFAGSSEYVNTKLNIEFFSLFWGDLTTNLKNCFTSGKSFFANTAATILAFFSASAAGALAYEGLEFSKPLASTFAALNSGLFFISRYIGVNRVLKRFLNRKNSTLQEQLIDEMSHLNKPYRKQLKIKLNEVVGELLRKKKPEDEKVLNESDFEVIFKELADELDRIKSKYENEALPNEPLPIFDGITKTRTEQAKEIVGNIFDNSFAAFIAAITLLTFAKKTKDGFGTLSDLLTGTDHVKDLSNLLKIIIGNPGGLASGMFFGISAKDFRYLCIETYNYLNNHPEEIGCFAKEVLFNIFATTSMFYVGTKFPGPNNEYNIPLNDVSYWLFGITEAIGAFGVNIVPMLKKYVERPDNKKPKLDQVLHHFRLSALNPVPGDILSNLSMFKPKEVKVEPKEKPIKDSKRIFQDAESHEQPEVVPAFASGYRR